MKKNTLEDYKEAIKAKYEEEKSGDYASFLINPSRAKLRGLCIILFTENSTSDDLRIFRNFFGFDFKDGISPKLKKETDKFRPLETFFKGETDLTDISGIDLAAILVRYNKRPIHRFLKETGATLVIKKEEPSYSILDNDNSASQEERNETAITKTIAVFDNTIKPKVSTTAILAQIQNKAISVKQIGKILMLLIIFLVSAYGAQQFISPKKECMQWQKDHYELVDCSIAGLGIMNEIKPTAEEELKLKKIEVSMQTRFFQKNKAIVWYCKNNGKQEYFNSAGFHPENGKPLKPISRYIIDKYIKQ